MGVYQEFIELTELVDNSKMLVRVANICLICRTEDGATIYTNGASVAVKEPYEEIKRMLDE